MFIGCSLDFDFRVEVNFFLVGKNGFRFRGDVFPCGEKMVFGFEVMFFLVGKNGFRFRGDFFCGNVQSGFASPHVRDQQQELKQQNLIYLYVNL